MKLIPKRRISALLLAALLIFSSLLAACQNGNSPDDVTVSATEAQTEAASAFRLTGEWYIVRPDSVNDYEVLALQLLNRAISSLCDANTHCTTDYRRAGDESSRNENEILIGRTNRAESVKATDSVGVGESYYEIIDEHTIVITGASGETTFTAAQMFAYDILGYAEDADKNVLSAGKDADLIIGTHASSATQYADVLVNGISLSAFTLVADKLTENLDKFNDKIAALCGKKLTTCLRSEFSGNGPAFFFGCADTASGHLNVPSDPYTYYVCASGNRITVDFKSSSMAGDVITCFCADYFNVRSHSVLGTVLTFPAEPTGKVAIPGEVNGLTLAERQDEKMAEGITYSELYYKDHDGLPVRVYAITVAPGAGSFYAGTPNDSFVQQEKVTQNVKKEIAAAVANGKKVIAGVNSGFFDLGGTGFSRGLVVKDGTLYAANTERPFFAQMKDGTVKILHASEYNANKANIMNAVAGNILLMRDGKILNIAKGTDMANTRHPRTAVGICPDGTVVIIAVDGRQPSVSNGASYGDLCDIFRSFGCTEVLNLDGGGSTTFIRKDASGNFVTENSPSDGALRSVQDSLFVLLP